MAQTYIDIAAVDPATDVTVISGDADVTVTKETVDGMDVIRVEKPTNGLWDVIFDQFTASETDDWEVWCATEVIQYTDGISSNPATGVAGNVINVTNNYYANSREDANLFLGDRSDQEGVNFDTPRPSAVLQTGRMVGVRMRLETDYTQRGKHWFESISGGEASTLDALIANESAGWDGSRTPAIQLGAGQIAITGFRGGTYRFYAIGIGTNGDPAPTEPVGVGGETITATSDPSLAADYAATLQPTPVTLAATADLTLAQDYAAAIGTQPDAIQATADASLSADYAALLQPQPVTLQATLDASGAADYAAAIQPTPVTLAASTDLSLGADYAATITEVDAPVVLQASADLSLGADYAASVVAVPVTISIGFDDGLGADFAAFLLDSSASQTVKARISTGERFTSNTSSSERVA